MGPVLEGTKTGPGPSMIDCVTSVGRGPRRDCARDATLITGTLLVE